MCCGHNHPATSEIAKAWADFEVIVRLGLSYPKNELGGTERVVPNLLIAGSPRDPLHVNKGFPGNTELHQV